jgi:hypothetical protein
MSRLRNITTGAVAAYVAGTLPAAAQSYGGGGWWSSFWANLFNSYQSGSGGGTQSAAAVPEIDASSGALALAAVLALTALSWELHRRRRG